MTRLRYIDKKIASLLQEKSKISARLHEDRYNSKVKFLVFYRSDDSVNKVNGSLILDKPFHSIHFI
jgi:tagatose-1,6-bisphosphate aldolase